MAETDNIEKKHNKSKIRDAAQKDESFITFYLHASLFLFFLMAYAFSLFLYKNKYPLILNNEILPEVLFFFFGLLVFSFVSLFLLSFWRFLVRVFIATIAGGAVAYILGLLFPFNIGNYIAHYTSFLPKEALLFLASNGNMIIAGISGFIFFVLLNIFKGGAMAFLTLPILVAMFMLLNTASKQTIPEKQRFALPASEEEKENETTENLIYLILADHTGYGAMVENWSTAFPDPILPTYIPSFYLSNNFSFFPSAYFRYQNKYRNIGNILNPSLTEIGDDLFDRNDAVYYVSSDDFMTSATRNDLFKALKEKGYAINVYQSYPFNYCKGAGGKDVSSCVTYPAPLGALYRTELTTASKLMLLAGHWIYSTPFGKQATEYVYSKLQTKLDPSKLPILGNPMSKSQPIGQSMVLSHLRHDVLQAKGKNVFFAHLNMPHHPYVYDQNCKLKLDPVTWRSYAPYTGKKEMNGETHRWNAYNQQLFCTYAQINYLMEDLKKAKLTDKTTVVIHGDKGADIRRELSDDVETTRVDRNFRRFKNNMTTVFGIYMPKVKAKINTGACDVATLVDRYVLKNTAATCQKPNAATLTQEEIGKAMTWVSAPIKAEWLAMKPFAPLYTTWLESGGQAYMSLLDERLKKEMEAADTAKISFVAPPSFMDAQPKTETAVKEKTTAFVPVPEKTDKPAEAASEATLDMILEMPPETTAKEPVLPEDENISPAGDTETADKKTEKPEKGKAAKKTKGRESKKAPETQTESDDLGKLPAPIILPETNPDTTDKWKATNIKEGQQTTLELLPSAVVEADSLKNPPDLSLDLPATQATLPDLPATLPDLPATLPDLPATLPELTASPVEEAPLPQAAPAAQVDVLPLPAAAETKAITDAEEQIKAAEKVKAEAEEIIAARAKTEEEARTKAEAEACAKAEAEAKIKAEAEARAKAEAEAKIKAEAEAKVRAEMEAKIKAEAEAKVRAEMEAKIKAAQEAQEKAKQAEAERKTQEDGLPEEEERHRNTPPPPANADELDIIKETQVERINEDGEVETLIYLERKPNPNKFKKKPAKERVLTSQEPERLPEVPEPVAETQPLPESPALPDEVKNAPEQSTGAETLKTESVITAETQKAEPAVKPQKETEEEDIIEEIGKRDVIKETTTMIETLSVAPEENRNTEQTETDIPPEAPSDEPPPLPIPKIDLPPPTIGLPSPSQGMADRDLGD